MERIERDIEVASEELGFYPRFGARITKYERCLICMLTLGFAMEKEYAFGGFAGIDI